jgi:DNA-binding helix-hairpin-helix protein with protein kinase domain
MSGKPVLVGEAAPKQITSFQEDNFIKSIEHPVDRGLLTWALKEYGIESAQDIRNYAENQIKKGVKIQDPTKYMAKCFREGWGLKSPEEKEKEKRDKEKSQNLKMKRRRKEVFEYITEEVRRQRNECFKKREAELTEKELEQYKTEFEKEHKEKGGDPKFKKMSWFIYIKAKLLSPEIEDFRKFAKEKKFDYDALKTEFES